MTPLTFHLIPHVHWDREWYLSRSTFLARLVPMMDQLLELLESAPSLRWHLDGQMILVEDYLAVVPGAGSHVRDERPEPRAGKPIGRKDGQEIEDVIDRDAGPP